MRVFFVILVIIFSINLTYGQNAPVTVAGTINEPTPGSITVPITVTNFQNIGAISLSLDYDYSVLNFVDGIQNSSIPGWFIITDNDLGNGFHRILMGWYGSSVSLPDGSSIMDIEFTYIEGSTILAWFDQGGSCEYADDTSTPLNDIPTSDYYFNGHICGTLGNPNPIIGSTELCQGETGVTYSTESITNANSYNWTVPSGTTIATGQNTNAITVNFSNTAVSGMITVEGVNQCTSGTTEQLSVSVNELPVADAGDDITIPYETNTVLTAASGGSGTYAYNWTPSELLEDPTMQNPQTVLLTTSNLFVVNVSDNASTCQNSDSVLVSITGGPLSASPIAAPGDICLGETSQLYANAGGGSGNYTYNWTSTPTDNPPWSSTLENPVVSPDSSRVYQVEVYDGFTTTDGQTNLQVFELPTAIISGSDTLCGENASTTLTVDLSGEPPWSFIYSYQSNTIQVEDVLESPYLISASDSGTYVLLDVMDVNCTGTTEGFAIVQKYPEPESPTIYQDGNELISDKPLGNQWYLNGEKIVGATEQKYIPNVSGQYYDVVCLNSCESEPSNIIEVTVVEVNELKADAFQLNPNPAKDKVQIKFNQCYGDEMQLTICSAYGKVVEKKTLQCTGNEITLDISRYKPGLYFVNIVNGGREIINKLIVN